jgi:hypothetical protein
LMICPSVADVRNLSAHKSSRNRIDAQPLVQFKSFDSVGHANHRK